MNRREEKKRTIPLFGHFYDGMRNFLIPFFRKVGKVDGIKTLEH